jgi:hypothetical protein
MGNIIFQLDINLLTSLLHSSLIVLKKFLQRYALARMNEVRRQTINIIKLLDIRQRLAIPAVRTLSLFNNNQINL